MTIFLVEIGCDIDVEETSNGCWIWEGAMLRNKPVLRLPNKRMVMVRRVLWEQIHDRKLGASQLGQHLCSAPRCCNPGHFAPGHDIGHYHAAPPTTHWFETNERGCWIWTGKRHKHGYGYYMHQGRRVLAHVHVRAFIQGEQIKKGVYVRHACDNPPCCNPDHLLAGTPRQNAQDMAIRLRGACKLTWDNVAQIKEMQASGMSIRKIAREFHVTHKTISRVCRGRTYTHEKLATGPRFLRVLPKPATPCWLWEGYPKDGPYGRVKIQGKWQLVHRRAWELTYGPVPAGLVVMHACDNKKCIRIDHLELGTHQDNTDDNNAKLGNGHVLTYEQADQIRALRQSGLGYAKIGERFDVHASSVMRICRDEIYVRPVVVGSF